jgi:hypothetical protein
MTPKFWSAIAVQWYGRRWLLMATALGYFVLLALLPLNGRGATSKVLFALSGPLVFLPWGLLCACIWFHPKYGRMQAGGGSIDRLPQFIRSSISWYSAIFLCAFILFGTIGIPVLVFSWLS